MDGTGGSVARPTRRQLLQGIAGLGLSAGGLALLAGLHVGCFELIGTDRVQAVSQLKGKTAGVLVLGSPQHMFLASIAAYVGLDPRVDINFVELPGAESMRRLEEGTIDAFIGFPPDTQELRA